MGILSDRLIWLSSGLEFSGTDKPDALVQYLAVGAQVPKSGPRGVLYTIRSAGEDIPIPIADLLDVNIKPTRSYSVDLRTTNKQYLKCPSDHLSARGSPSEVFFPFGPHQERLIYPLL